MIKKLRTAMIAGISILLLTGCAINSGQPKKLEVKVQVWAMKYLVQEIGKDEVNVSLAVTSGDAHHKEPTQKEIAELSKSALFFYIGAGDVGREAEELMKATETNKEKNIDLMQGVEAITNGTETDPHVWLSPKQMIVMAETVKNKLIEKKQDKKSDLEKNYTELIGKLQKLDKELVAQFAQKTNKEILVEHPAYTYMARDYGFEQHGLSDEGHDHEEEASKASSTSGENSELSASQIEELRTVVAEKQMAYLFSDSQNQSEMTMKVAKELNLTIEKVSTLETLSEAEAKVDYLGHVKEIAEKFAKEME